MQTHAASVTPPGPWVLGILAAEGVHDYGFTSYLVLDHASCYLTPCGQCMVGRYVYLNPLISSLQSYCTLTGRGAH